MSGHCHRAIAAPAMPVLGPVPTRRTHCVHRPIVPLARMSIRLSKKFLEKIYELNGTPESDTVPDSYPQTADSYRPLNGSSLQRIGLHATYAEADETRALRGFHSTWIRPF